MGTGKWIAVMGGGLVFSIAAMSLLTQAGWAFHNPGVIKCDDPGEGQAAIDGAHPGATFRIDGEGEEMDND